MGHELLVLIVEDSEDDALMTVRELERGGYKVQWERVETEPSMKTALWKKHWDAILCDYRMPKFSAIRALEVAKESGLDVPFIIISGAIGEDLAVEAMKLGAHDYLMKDKMTRLVSAVEREMREARVRKERSNVEGRLRDMLDCLMEGCQIFTFDWKCVYVNDSAMSQIGKVREEILGRTFKEIYPKIDKTDFHAAIETCMTERKPQRFVGKLVKFNDLQDTFDITIQPVPEGVMILSLNEKKQDKSIGKKKK
jgi:FixJ family two-component response regulator